jgi:hypothetical protein
MYRVHNVNRNIILAASLGVVVCLAIGVTPCFGEDEPSPAKIPTVYRDAYTVTIKGKPDANGTFSMVLKPHGEDGTEFTVNVVKGMGAKKVAYALSTELTIAAGDRYKVKHNDKKVVVKKRNKQSPPLAIEMTNQKFTGMSIMIGK